LFCQEEKTKKPPKHPNKLKGCKYCNCI